MVEDKPAPAPEEADTGIASSGILSLRMKNDKEKINKQFGQ
jgi:hypothetical protein